MSSPWKRSMYTEPVRLLFRPSSPIEGIVLRSAIEHPEFLAQYTHSNIRDGLVSAIHPVAVGYLLMSSEWTVHHENDTLLHLTTELPIHSGISDIQFHPEHIQYVRVPVHDSLGGVMGYYFQVQEEYIPEVSPTIDRYTDYILEYRPEQDTIVPVHLRSSCKQDGLHIATTVVLEDKVPHREVYSLKDLLQLQVRYVTL